MPRSTSTRRPRLFWAGVVILATATAGAVVPLAGAATKPPAAKPPADQWQRQMLAQRPLVDAATRIRSAAEQSGAGGYTSVALAGDAVELRWKGGSAALPRAVNDVIAQVGATAPVRVAEAKYSWAELLDASADLESRYAADPDFVAIRARPDGSGLELALDQDPGTPRTLAAAGTGVDTSIVAETAPVPVSRDDDTPPWSGGADMTNTKLRVGCTSGFGVDTPSGPAILTAGHCGNAGDRFTDGRGETIGSVSQVDKTLDIEIIPTTAVSNRMYVGGANSNTRLTVVGGGTPVVGEVLCQSGNTSANAVGGPVCNLRVTGERTDSQRLWEAVQLQGQAGARPGDSGGPVYLDRGDGTVLARGTSTAVAGRKLLFAGLEKAQKLFGVSIPGAGGGAVTPPPPNPPNPPAAGVVFFRQTRFGGTASQALPPGRYTRAQLAARGFANDTASSVRVPAGRSVVMFDHDNFAGQSWTLSGAAADFRTLRPNANNRVSSLIVR